MSCKKLVSLGSLLVVCMALTCLGQATGTIRYEVWDGIGGTNINDLKNNPRYPDQPDFDEELTLFESPTNRADNFGGKLSGWVYPPETADYTFWLAADDGAEVWLSTDDDPANAVLLVAEDSWGGSRDWFDRGQKSDPVALMAGEKYYIEGLYKEGGGGDNIAVAWQINADPDPNATIDPNDVVVIPGEYLSPAPRKPFLFKAKLISPADGAVDLLPEVTIEWTPGPTAIMSKVYVSTDDVFEEADAIAQTQDASLTVTLEPGTMYYLRIDAVDMAGVHEGLVSTFSVIPLEAHFPMPADGAVLIPADAMLTWTAGLDALVHNVFLSADPALVEDRDPSVQVGQWLSMGEFVPTAPLDLDTTYYWAVDEFLGLETNPGPMWSFTTVPSMPIVDDRLVAWYTMDKLDPTHPDSVVVDWSGNNNHGMAMGAVDDIMIVDDAAMGAVLSLPGGTNTFVDCGDVGLSGNDPTTIACWAKADHTNIPNWTLIFGFTGQEDGSGGNGSHFNIGSLGGPGGIGAHVWGWEETIVDDANGLEWNHYAMTYDGTTIAYYGNGVLTDTEPEDVKTNVRDLSTRGDRVYIGSRITHSNSFPGDVDDCRVYNVVLGEAEILAIAMQLSDVTSPDDVVVGVPDEPRDGAVGGWPANEHPALALDDNAGTKFLHFRGDTAATGFQVDTAVPSVVTGLLLTTANDCAGRDPIAYEVYGANAIDGPYELIANGDIVDFAIEGEEWPRFTKNATPITFENTMAYTCYQVLFPAIRGPVGDCVNSMQIAEVELLGKTPTIAWVSYHAGDNQPHSSAAEHGFTQAPDIEYTDLLKGQGYNVTRYVTTKSPDVDYLNGFDLVIVSRTASSGHYSGSGATLWNSITAPLINLNGYTLRSSRLGFTDGGTMVDTTGDVKLAVTDPTHPIFAGIALTDGVMDNPFAEGAVPLTTDPTIISRGVSINNNTLDEEGTVLATIAEASADTGPVGGLMIAELPAGATLQNSSGSADDVLGADRLIFLTGSREPSGVTGGQAAALYDLYEDGTQMLLNAVKYMLQP